MLVGFEHVGLAVSDLDRSIAFYCDLVGMRLILRKPMGAGGEQAFLDAGNAQLEMFCPAPAVATPARSVPDSEAGVRHLTFAVSDVDAMFSKLVAAGVPAHQQPRDAFNKEIVKRVAFVVDPDGILVELVERAA